MKAIEKKLEILNYIFKSEDGASWNEVSEMLNQLIDICNLQVATEQRSIAMTLAEITFDQVEIDFLLTLCNHNMQGRLYAYPYRDLVVEKLKKLKNN